jgi:hypothetical protein
LTPIEDTKTMRRTVHATLVAALLAVPAFTAMAKLPPLSDEAKAKAAEAAAKTAWTDKVGAFQLCRAMERTAAHYRRTAKGPKPAVETPPCADPGPFVAPAPAASAASAPASTTVTKAAAAIPAPVKK